MLALVYGTNRHLLGERSLRLALLTLAHAQGHFRVTPTRHRWRHNDILLGGFDLRLLIGLHQRRCYRESLRSQTPHQHILQQYQLVFLQRRHNTPPQADRIEPIYSRLG